MNKDKIKLAVKVNSILERLPYTQEEAAILLGISQPRVSNIKNIRVDSMTIDSLIGYLDVLGYNTKLTIKKRN